ncbi:sensitivity to red-light reduced protein [Entomophthora muscae]|uniref:Sensitivity to red-light reduced protein n=1 Tax=Entomophthora muscae TaxID=34485 RepID=A0ACC2RMV5_9FUNG|nr:sensitivity to red-light reduced protein [Entomophthora muscae]
MCDKRVGSRWLEMSELCLGLHQLMSRKLRVLIVDDNSMFRRILRRMIQVYCNQKVESIHEASNPVDGLKLLGEKPFDFVFMDIDMPELSGIETTKIIRGHDPRWKLHPPPAAALQPNHPHSCCHHQRYPAGPSHLCQRRHDPIPTKTLFP